MRTGKVSIIGTGSVGSSIASMLTLMNIAREIVLIDRNTALAEAEALDIRSGMPQMMSPDLYAGGYADISGSDLIIITAGRNRKPGEDRLMLVDDNIRVMREVADQFEHYYTGGAVLVISNPVDILTYKMNEWLGLPDGMVFGSGCVLDSARFARCVADYLRVPADTVFAVVVGEHGDSQVLLWSRLSVGAAPMAVYCEASGIAYDAAVRARITNDVVHMGGRIIAGKGRTHYGVAACASCIARAVLQDMAVTLSVSSLLRGEYGVEGVAMSVPSVVNARGVVGRIAGGWSEGEARRFRDSASTLKQVLGIK